MFFGCPPLTLELTSDDLRHDIDPMLVILLLKGAYCIQSRMFEPTQPGHVLARFSLTQFAQ